MQKLRFATGKPLASASVPDEKSARYHTTSFVRHCPKNGFKEVPDAVPLYHELKA
jgi:hypothetical protein